MTRLITCILLGLIASLSTAAFADEQPSQLAGFQRAVGKWVNSERIRDSRDATWETGESEWVVRFMPGGLVVETPGQMKLGDNPTVSWVQVWGIDPTNGNPFSRWFTNDGANGNANFEWSDRTVKAELTVTAANGSQNKEQCDWTFGADFNTASLVCRRQSGDAWWVFREANGKRSD